MKPRTIVKAMGTALLALAANTVAVADEPVPRSGPNILLERNAPEARPDASAARPGESRPSAPVARPGVPAEPANAPEEHADNRGPNIIGEPTAFSGARGRSGGLEWRPSGEFQPPGVVPGCARCVAI